jgi:hypothetical protein
MRGPEDVDVEVLWSIEGDAWVGTLGRPDDLSRDAGGAVRHSFEVELLLRATDWHVEMSHVARGAFEREHIQAADPEEAMARAADLLLAFRAKCEAPFDDEREAPPSPG